MDRVQEFPVNVTITLMQRSRPGKDKSSMNKEKDMQIWKRNPDGQKAGGYPGPEDSIFQYFLSESQLKIYISCLIVLTITAYNYTLAKCV